MRATLTLRHDRPHQLAAIAGVHDMKNTDPIELVLGLAAWLAVAVFAVIAVANWDPLWGFFPVLAAVLAAWAIGEYVTGRERATGASR